MERRGGVENIRVCWHRKKRKGSGERKGPVGMGADSWKGTCCDSHTLSHTEAYCVGCLLGHANISFSMSANPPPHPPLIENWNKISFFYFQESADQFVTKGLVKVPTNIQRVVYRKRGNYLLYLNNIDRWLMFIRSQLFVTRLQVSSSVGL